MTPALLGGGFLFIVPVVAQIVAQHVAQIVAQHVALVVAQNVPHAARIWMTKKGRKAAIVPQLLY